MSIIKHFLYYMHTFNEAPIKTFLFQVDSYLIKRIKHVNTLNGFYILKKYIEC